MLGDTKTWLAKWVSQLSIDHVVWAGNSTLWGFCITKYGSTLYVGMDEVWAHYACTFENSDLHFHFQ